mmetsp:Transcript_61349/g.182753  ORF Transcript_61349/g.182753 Transcript_61349/m.182753 type:complete len:208 (+) Transcript_61349:760-1383(+)
MFRTCSMSRAAALGSLWNCGRPVEESKVRRKSCWSTRSGPSGRRIRTHTGAVSLWSTTVCTRSSWEKSSWTASKMSPLVVERLQKTTTSRASRSAFSSAYSSAHRIPLVPFRSRRTTSAAKSSTEGHCSILLSNKTQSRVRSFCACARSASHWRRSACLSGCAASAAPWRFLLQRRTHSMGTTMVSLATFLMAWTYSSRLRAECRLS